MGVASGEVGVYQLKNVPHTADEVSYIAVAMSNQLTSYIFHLQIVLLSVVEAAVKELH